MTERNGPNPAAERRDGHNVIAVSFPVAGSAYRALTSLYELDSQHRVRTREAVVVARDEDGELVVKQRVESTRLPGAAGGGLIGLLLGVLGGPTGVLVGGSYVGSPVDVSEISEAGSSLAAISGSVRFGRTTVLAVVQEQSPAILDSAMSELEGTVVRRTVDEVEAAIAVAESAQRTAKREARTALIRRRHEQRKAAAEATLEDLQTKLRHGRRTQTDDAAAPDGSVGS